ncbi:MAG: AfsR/SARP family transcriptional regulator [Dactylosporangium sp.]|nr:winged helix-turn-helix domain-containing protein [Dactylosporangium sp.]NNJ62829.1 AfsR/SARP family transcriptional regulator [Dactylosporangium sp.]
MRFEILGPLTARTGDNAPVVVRSRNERTLLAMLLLRAGQPVHVEHLVEALWPDKPPASHMSNLHTYLSRLRDRLPDVTIGHVNGCYQLPVTPAELDLLEFRDRAAAGRAALDRDDPATAVGHLRYALGQWRGRPLEGTSVAPLEAEIVQLEAERLEAVEERIAAEFAVGARLTSEPAADPADVTRNARPDGPDVTPATVGQLVCELQRLVTEYPLRERLHAHLMTALCQAGRRADALSAYHTARKALITQLGIEPCQQLQRLHQAILRGDGPVLRRPRRRRLPERKQPFPVCQLPPPVTGFVGRGEAIQRICALAAPTATTVPVVVISGQPGVGKSALAVLVAHRIRAEFPDGQLFVQLGGIGGESPDPEGALTHVLHALDAPASAVPRDRAALSAAYRTRLADRRVLVVLDDAADPDQVRALTPGTPGSAVLVTSRSRLSGLTDATRVSLGPLDDAEACQLLTQIVGPAPGAGENRQVGRVAAVCGNVPLALRIAGTRVATRGMRLTTLADRLDDERRRLSELVISDQQVRASLALSVEALSGPAREMFTLLGLVGPVSFSAWTAAALVTRPDTDRVLDELVEAHLLDPVPAESEEPAVGDTRYRRHDLLRVYAEELAAALPDQGRAARLRLLETAVGLADVAARNSPRVLTWSRLATPPQAKVASGPAVRWAAERAAAQPQAWLAAERQLLLSCFAAACIAGADRPAALLAERIAPYLWVGGFWADLDQVRRRGKLAARACGLERVQLLMEFVEGVLHLVRGNLLDAAVSFAAGEAGFRRLGDRHGLACVLSDQAVLHDYQNRAADSERAAWAAVELFRAEGDEVGAMLASPGRSAALRCLGRLGEALDVDRAVVAAARKAGVAPVVLARCLHALALSQLLADRPDRAYAAAEEAVQLMHRTGDRYVLLAALRDLALASASLGRRSEAVGLLERSHRLAVELGDRLWAVGLERDIAVSWIGDGRSNEAVGVLCRCLAAFHETRFRAGQATTLGALARAYEDLGRASAGRAARRGAARLADPGDARTPRLAALVLRLADPVGHPGFE